MICRRWRPSSDTQTEKSCVKSVGDNRKYAVNRPVALLVSNYSVNACRCWELDELPKNGAFYWFLQAFFYRYYTFGFFLLDSFSCSENLRPFKFSIKHKRLGKLVKVLEAIKMTTNEKWRHIPSILITLFWNWFWQTFIGIVVYNYRLALSDRFLVVQKQYPIRACIIAEMNHGIWCLI